MGKHAISDLGHLKKTTMHMCASMCHKTVEFDWGMVDKRLGQLEGQIHF